MFTQGWMALSQESGFQFTGTGSALSHPVTVGCRKGFQETKSDEGDRRVVVVMVI